MGKYGEQNFSTRTLQDSTKALREELGKAVGIAQTNERNDMYRTTEKNKRLDASADVRRQEARMKVVDARHEIEYNKEQARLKKSWDHKIGLENEAKAQDMALASILNSSPTTKTVDIAATDGNAADIAEMVDRNTRVDKAEKTLDAKVMAANSKFVPLYEKYYNEGITPKTFIRDGITKYVSKPIAPAVGDTSVNTIVMNDAYKRAIEESGMADLTAQYELPGYTREVVPELVGPTEATTEEVALTDADKSPAYMRDYYSNKIRENTTLTGTQQVNAISKLPSMFPDAPSAKPSDTLAENKFKAKVAEDAATVADFKEIYKYMPKGINTVAGVKAYDEFEKAKGGTGGKYSFDKSVYNIVDGSDSNDVTAIHKWLEANRAAIDGMSREDQEALIAQISAEYKTQNNSNYSFGMEHSLPALSK